MEDVQSLRDYSGDRTGQGVGGGMQWTKKSAIPRDTWEQAILNIQ